MALCQSKLSFSPTPHLDLYTLWSVFLIYCQPDCVFTENDPNICTCAKCFSFSRGFSSDTYFSLLCLSFFLLTLSLKASQLMMVFLLCLGPWNVSRKRRLKKFFSVFLWSVLPPSQSTLFGFLPNSLTPIGEWKAFVIIYW